MRMECAFIVLFGLCFRGTLSGTRDQHGGPRLNRSLGAKGRNGRFVLGLPRLSGLDRGAVVRNGLKMRREEGNSHSREKRGQKLMALF